VHREKNPDACKHGRKQPANAALFRAAGCISWLDVNSPLDLIAQPDALALALPATTGRDAVEVLHGCLGLAGGAIVDPPQMLADVIERMDVASVCIADDIAVPHARTAAVSRLVLGVGRTSGNVTFDQEHPRVRLVFLIGTPKAAVTEHLQLVAGLSRWLKNSATRAALIAAPGEAEFRTLLQTSAVVGAALARAAKR